MVSDDTSLMELVFFRSHPEYLAGILPVGAKRIVSGRIERFKDRLQMAHPDYVVAPEEIANFPLHEPVYGLTEGLTPRPMAKAVRGRAGESAGAAGMAGPGICQATQMGQFQCIAGDGTQSGS